MYCSFFSVHGNGNYYALLIGVCLIVHDSSGFLNAMLLVLEDRWQYVLSLCCAPRMSGSERGLLRQGMHHRDRGVLGWRILFLWTWRGGSVDKMFAGQT